jgi:nicotinate phosphoribosyltransferase
LRGGVQGVRIDSADPGHAAHLVRAALDARGMKDAKIVASGQLDEHRVAALVQAGAPIDRFAIGRALAAAGDPGLPMAFRIAEMHRARGPEPVPRAGSAAFPGRKQIARAADRDLLCLESETWSLDLAGAQLLLEPVMRRGERTGPERSLADLRRLRAERVHALPPGLRRLDRPDAWPVVPSDAVAALALK